MASKEQVNKINTLIKELQKVWTGVNANASLSIVINNDYIDYFALDDNDNYIIRHTEMNGDIIREKIQ